MGVKLPFDEKQKEAILNQLSEYDITVEPRRFNQRPVIFWHGHKDTTVPFKNTYHFYTELRSHYEQSPEKLKFIESKILGIRFHVAAYLLSHRFFLNIWHK